MMFRCCLAENRKWRIHPFPSQLFAAEDLDSALPDRLGTGMLKLVGLLGKPRNRGTARSAHNLSVARSSHLQQIPFLPHINRPRRAHLEHHSLRLMNVPAEKVFRLMLLDELAHRAAACVQSFLD